MARATRSVQQEGDAIHGVEERRETGRDTRPQVRGAEVLDMHQIERVLGEDSVETPLELGHAADRSLKRLAPQRRGETASGTRAGSQEHYVDASTEAPKLFHVLELAARARCEDMDLVAARQLTDEVIWPHPDE